MRLITPLINCSHLKLKTPHGMKAPDGMQQRVQMKCLCIKQNTHLTKALWFNQHLQKVRNIEQAEVTLRESFSQTKNMGSAVFAFALIK